MTLRRLPDWQPRLIALLARIARTPFEEGSNDCALLLADAVEAMTGVDYAAPYRGRYTTTRGGLRVLRKDGFRDHFALARHHLREKPVAFAAPGDGALVEVDGIQALGVFQGAQVYVRTPDRLGLVPMTAARAALEV